MTLAILEADLKEAAVKLGVEVDQLAHLVRHELAELVLVHEDNQDVAHQIVAAAQPAPVAPAPAPDAPVEAAPAAAE